MGIKEYFDGFFSTIQKKQRSSEIKLALKVAAEFCIYADMYARANPHILHHVYEWNMVGSPRGRLFELSVIPTNAGAVISYEFLQSRVPNDNGQIFSNKASVMESGTLVSFTTDKAVPIEDTFRTGTFTFKPGGPQVTGAFEELFVTYIVARNISVADFTYGRSSATRSAGVIDGMRVYDNIGR